MDTIDTQHIYVILPNHPYLGLMLHLARSSGEDHASTGVPPSLCPPEQQDTIHVLAKQPAHSREVLSGTPIYTVYVHNIKAWVECENKDISIFNIV